jgi:hypothetical protein
LPRFDRLSLLEKRLRQRVARSRLKRGSAHRTRKNDAPGVTWEFLEIVCALIEADAREQAEALAPS